MHFRSVNDVRPLRAAHGETIYETVGRAAGGTATHSLAQIVLPPGCASLKHYHPEAEETYHILSGSGDLEIDGKHVTVQPGDSILIEPGETHRIANHGDSDLVFLAICVPAWTPDNSVFVE